MRCCNGHLESEGSWVSIYEIRYPPQGDHLDFYKSNDFLSTYSKNLHFPHESINYIPWKEKSEIID